MQDMYQSTLENPDTFLAMYAQFGSAEHATQRPRQAFRLSSLLQLTNAADAAGGGGGGNTDATTVLQLTTREPEQS